MLIHVLAVTLALAAGSDPPQGSEPVKLDPADFTTKIDNRYFPMAPGARWVYRETGENGRPQRDTVTVLHRTKKVAAGVRARVVHDVATQGGRVVEETFDWYAQAGDGSVWYVGEDTTEYRADGTSTRAGSWEAGVRGAQAGVIMPAHPRPGLRYRQEYAKGHAEDRAEIAALHGRATVPFGRFSDVLVTRDTDGLDPAAFEHKYYALGIGPVLGVSRGGSREELVSFRRSG